jgi:hypothetical protein
MINLTPLNGVDQDPIPSADVRTSMITSMHKTTTPLNAAFFQQANLERIQAMLRKQFKDETGLSIDRQNPRDVMTFMRYVYINNAMNPYGNIESQMTRMNQQVVDKMLPQVREGVSSYILYVRDASTNYVPNPLPKNTTLAGDRLPINNRIGMGGPY